LKGSRNGDFLRIRPTLRLLGLRPRQAPLRPALKKWKGLEEPVLRMNDTLERYASREDKA